MAKARTRSAVRPNAHRRRVTGGPDLSGIRILILDFDGVMTDNRVLVMEDGKEGVVCNRSDGLGVGMLRDRGFPIVVISTETNPVVSARCKKLKIPCTQGHEDKLAALKEVLEERGFAMSEAAYVGNDMNDLPCMRAVGLPIAVADAYPEILAVAKLVTKRAGGFGAVREVTDMVMDYLRSA